MMRLALAGVFALLLAEGASGLLAHSTAAGHEAAEASTTITSCFDAPSTGVYMTTEGFNVLCDMDTAGGGWQLLLTQLDAETQYSGSVNPFIQTLNENAPSETTAYSRDWDSSSIAPVTGSEFLLKNGESGDWVRFEETHSWCGWDNSGDCHGASSHRQFTHGQLYDSSDNALAGFVYFNACLGAGGCSGGDGGDGVGFGTHNSWLDDDGCYGGCYGTGVSSAHFFWGDQTEVPGPFTYWYRIEARTSSPTAAPTPPTPIPPQAQAPFSSGSSSTSAKGDPHLQNINGQRFDLMRAGRHVLIHIPRNADAPSILLSVVADVLRLGAQCGETYFQHINITGAWAQGKHNGVLQFHADDVAGKEEATWMTFGAVNLKVVHAQHLGGIRYLNIYAKHLGRVQFKIGGLLGEDDHEYEATPDEDCVPKVSFYTMSPQGHPPASPSASIAEASFA